jgi:hypothetical protein
MVKFLLVTAFMFFGYLGNATADVGEVGSVGYLLKVCKIEQPQDIESIWDQGYCYGTITASMRYLLILERYENSSFDMPDEIKIGQLQAIFVKWAQEHPEAWHKADHIGMLQAVVSVFVKK